MNDNELDDLFRSNADYLSDQPHRDFDKGSFWQHMQAALPKKAHQPKKPVVWGWAAAALLVAGLWGGIGWMKSNNKGEDQKLAQKTYNAPAPTLKNSEPIARVPQKNTPIIENKNPHPLSSQTAEANVALEGVTLSQDSPRVFEKSEQKAPPGSTGPDTEPVILAMKEYVQPEPVAEGTPPLPEVVFRPAREKSHYRVVHINEVRERKQQQAKARTRLAFRVGVPSGTRVTTQSDHSSPLSIPIQN